MKKCILSLALVLAMLLGLLPTSALAAGGSGREGDPILISTAQELAALATAVGGGDDYTGKFIKLTQSIDLSSVCGETLGTSWTPIGQSTGDRFNGSLDGDGHTVSGLYIATDQSGNYGLFGAIGTGGTVTGLTVEGSVTGPGNMGAVAGVNYGAITHCHSTAAVTGSSGTAHIGGIAGENQGTIARCSNSGAVGCTYTPGQDDSAMVMVGGIAGYNLGTIRDCCNVGPISSLADGYIGGVAGYNTSGTVENCYNAFTVKVPEGTAAYGLCSGGTVTNSYYDTSKVDAADDGGIPGDAFMDQDRYFTGWDFINVWRMDAALKRPVLRAPGDPDAHVHPLCGTGDCPHDAPHGDIVWTQWTDGTKLPDRVGNFYLTTDVALSGAWSPVRGTRLCLNGRSITQDTANTLALLINEGAVFDLCDCTGAAAGTVTSNGREGVSCLGDFSLYGGSISGNTAASGVELISGTFHMYGGLIRNNGGAALTGGGVNVEGGAFHMYGGRITGNTAQTGGGVSVARNGTFTMLGGEITGNTAAGFCGGVAFTNGGTLTVGGRVVIAENTAADQPSNFGADYNTKIAISQPLTQGANIGVFPYDDPPTADRPLEVTTQNNTDYSAYFHSDDPDYEIVNDANNVVQLIPYVKYQISQQPAADNGYTVAAQERTENGGWTNAASASYQWYETQSTVYPVADADSSVPEGALGASVNAGTDTGDGTWDSTDGWITLQFADDLALQAGDTVTAIPSPDFSGDCMAMIGMGTPEGLMPGTDGAYSYVMPEDGNLTFGLGAEQEEDAFSAAITVTRTTRTSVNGQNTPTLGITWGGKTYVCAVTFEDGTVLTSNAVTVPLFQGAGTAASPYLIPDLAALEGFQDYINAGSGQNEHFRLTADVDLSPRYGADVNGGTSWTPIGKGLVPFNGVFDGDGHTVKNLYINTTEEGYFGLFGVIDGTGTVKNLKVNGALKAGGFIGGVAGKNQGPISNCRSACTVEGTGRTGGIVGQNIGTVEGCHNTGTVTATVSGGGPLDTMAVAGGITGQNLQGPIARCYNAGDIQGVYISASDPSVGEQGTATLALGGIAGTASGTIQNCYNTGTVTSTRDGDYVSRLGGVTGRNGGGGIENCYSVGVVSGGPSTASIGGVAGSGGGSVASSYYDSTKVTPTTLDSDGTGIDAEAFRALATFVDWDFSATWELDAVLGRPVLRIPDHTHQWTYTADGAAISQSACTAMGCHLSGGGSVTLVAPTGDLTYNEGPHDATLTGAFQERVLPEIAYQRSDTEFGTYAGVLNTTAAGWYRASITVEGETAAVTYQIEKATPDVDTPQGLTARYGQTLSDVALPQGWAWDAPSTSVGNAGENTFPATYTPDDPNNYTTVTQNLTVTVEKATPVVPTPQNLTAYYGQTLSDVQLPQGWAWDAPSTSVGTVGENTFPATYTPTDPDNYTTVTQTLTVTVEKATPVVPTPQNLTAYYGQALSDVALPNGWAWNDLSTDVGTVGENTFPATYTPDDPNNYTTVTQTLTVTVEPASEDTPSIQIDYENETLTGFEVGARYAIGDEEVRPEGGTLPIIAAHLNQQLSIVRLARDGNHADSAPFLLPVPPRPGPPETLAATAESVQGRNDGKITGLSAEVVYEISDNDGQRWEIATVTESGEIVDLAPGEYQVRTKAVPEASAFAGEAATLIVGAGAERTYTLEVTAPTFDEVYEGYAQPDAQAIPIRSTGNSDATIISVAVNEPGKFTVAGDGTTVPAGGSIHTWTIRPAADLAVDTHRATITVTYNDDAAATAEVTFTVNALSHAWTWEITQEPTMDEPGQATHSCPGDDHHAAHSETGVEVPALSNTDVWAEDEEARVDPTEDTPGSRTYTSDYGTVTVPIPALGHTHVPVFVEGQTPDCENDGWMGYYACRCDTYFEDVGGQSVIDDLEDWKTGAGKLNAKGHAWGKWEVTTPADCETEGVETSVCANDPDHTQARPIDALGHAWSEWEMKIEPGLTATGTAERVCGHDDSHTETKPIPMLTDPTVWTLTAEQPPTDTEPGFKTYTSEYGEVTVPIPALGHIHVPVFVEGKAPDCENDGWRGYYACQCSADVITYFEDEAGETEIDDLETWKTGAGKLDALDHTWGDWSTDETHHWKLCPVCDQQGSHGEHVYTDDPDNACNICGYIKPEEPPTPSPGGSGRPSVYTPNLQHPDHGKITVSPPRATSGSKVTVTVTPDAGYEVDTVTVTDRNGRPVAVTRSADGTYTFTQPTGTVTIAAAVKEAACPRNETCPIAKFTDARVNAWYHDGIHFCVDRELMIGTTETAFAPEMPTSRAMITTILWRLQGSKVVNYAMQYEDVPEGAWYTEAVRWAAGEGIVTGYGNGNFGPDDPITREQLATMLYRCAGEPETAGTLGGFTDAGKASGYAQAALKWAVENGILTGKGGGVLAPQGQATRAEAAAMIQRFLTLK